jgi:hypothetical protein
LLVTIPQAASMVGRGPTFIYEALSTGQLEARKSDGRTLVTVASLHAYVDSLPRAKLKTTPRNARPVFVPTEPKLA